jgi:hypothetical protein
MMRSETEIQDQASEALSIMDQGSKVPGMSYEEGVHAALQWVLGDTDEPPIIDIE